MQIMKQRYVLTSVTGKYNDKCCIRLLMKTRFNNMSLTTGIRCLGSRRTVWLGDFDSQNVVMVYGGQSTQAVFT